MILCGSLLDEEGQQKGAGAFIQWAFQRGEENQGLSSVIHITDDLMSHVYKISFKNKTKTYWLLIESERWRVIVFRCVSNDEPN